MLIESPNASLNQSENLQRSSVDFDQSSNHNDHRLTERRIRIRIPKDLHQEPVISRLVSHYHLTVNITAAILGANAKGDGWFDLELKGDNTNIQSALIYLNELDLQVWNGEEADGW